MKKLNFEILGVENISTAEMQTHVGGMGPLLGIPLALKIFAGATFGAGAITGGGIVGLICHFSRKK